MHLMPISALAPKCGLSSVVFWMIRTSRGRYSGLYEVTMTRHHEGNSGENRVYITCSVARAMLVAIQDRLEKQSTAATAVTATQWTGERAVTHFRCADVDTATALLNDIEFARTIFSEARHRLVPV